VEPLEVELLREPEKRGALPRDEAVAGEVGAREALEGPALWGQSQAFVLR
jgi:hypothetical protein